MKDKILKETEQILADIDREMQNLEFQTQRMMSEQAKLDLQGLTYLRAQVEDQKQRLTNAKAKAQSDQDQAAQLEIGSEITQGQLEQTVTVKVGDDLNKLMGLEILLEDGKVAAFRQ